MLMLAEEITSLRLDVEAMGSLPLLPVDDFVEYSALCERILALAADVADRDPAETDPEAAAALYRLGLALRRAGDGLAAAEVLEVTGEHARAMHDAKTASSAFNSAGITLYQLGVYGKANGMLERAIEVLDDDDFGRVRATGVRLNRANVLHYERRFAEAEDVYLELAARVEATPPDLFARHSTFVQTELLGFLNVNVAGNRLAWAQADAQLGLDTSEHLLVADRQLREGDLRPLKSFNRTTADCLRASLMIMEGRTEAAEGVLASVAMRCAGDRELLPLLPQVYRYAAEACVARGDAERALLECHKALESSLAVANGLEERGVVETFVDLLRISGRCVLDPTEAAGPRAAKFSAAAKPLVEALVDFLERKDWYTGNGHSRAVATLSARLARVLVAREGAAGERARSEVDERALVLAATLHDIGKLALPWSLLNKIVPLKPWEMELMRSHVALGEELLSRVGLPDVGALAAEHHETPAGTGYPRGTRSQSLMGSILAVADAFEAMTTVNRRYRTPKPLDVAVREIEAGAGTQFDADVAAALVTLFEARL